MKCPKCKTEIGLLGRGFGKCKNSHRVFIDFDGEVHLLENEPLDPRLRQNARERREARRKYAVEEKK